MAKKSKSSKPSGLKITRDGNKFICEWKIPSAKYGDGQQFKATTASSGDISKTATKKTVTIDLSARYPASGGKKLKNFQSRTIVCVKAIHPTSDFVGRGFLASYS